MLKMYIGYPTEGMQGCAVLIFAHNFREARNLAYKTLNTLIDCEFIETRVNRLWGNVPHLLNAADKNLYENDIAHVIDNPPSCESCEVWGEDIVVEEGMDLCGTCYEDDLKMEGG